MAVFLRLGYGSASMDLIAAEAGVSTQTIYNHFHSKDELFKAIITDMTATLVTPLSVRDAAASSPGRLLRSLGRDLLSLMLKPSSLALYRLIVAESARFPELGGDIYAVGAGRLIALLADYLSWETKNGRLAVTDPERAAEQFIGGLDDCGPDARLEPAERHVGLRGGLLHEDRGGDEIGGRAQSADRKVRRSPGRLDPVVGVFRDSRFTERIALGPHR